MSGPQGGLKAGREGGSFCCSPGSASTALGLLPACLCRAGLLSGVEAPRGRPSSVSHPVGSITPHRCALATVPSLPWEVPPPSTPAWILESPLSQLLLFLKQNKSLRGHEAMPTPRDPPLCPHVPMGVMSRHFCRTCPAPSSALLQQSKRCDVSTKRRGERPSLTACHTRYNLPPDQSLPGSPTPTKLTIFLTN